MDKFFNKISILFIFVIISFAAFNPIDASGFKDTNEVTAILVKRELRKNTKNIRQLQKTIDKKYVEAMVISIAF